MKTGIFYGSSTGVTEDIANRVGKLLDADVIDASEISKAVEYDFLILATSTWGMGELQDTWIDALETFKSLSLSGKKVALIGTGDQAAFSDTFVDGIGTIYEAVIEKGLDVVGFTSTEGYEFNGSIGIKDDEFVGLVIDENNQSNLTDERITAWVAKIK